MRLIDADALMKVIREHDYPLRSHFNSTDNGMFTIGVQQAVDDAPTIDAVPVVRCGECVNAKRIDKNESVYTCTHPQWTRRLHKGTFEESQLFHGLDGNDFCSYGAKKEEQANG